MRVSASQLLWPGLLLSLFVGCGYSSPAPVQQSLNIDDTEPGLTEVVVDAGLQSASPAAGRITLVSNNSPSENHVNNLPEKLSSQQPESRPNSQPKLPAGVDKVKTQSPQQTATDSTTQAGKDFQPPYGERTNVFAPPNSPQSNHESSTTEPASVMTHDDNVSLKGFAKVDELRAILMIEETIAPLGVGQEKQGVRIISIEPPKVTLQRGEQSWSLTLSNQFSSSGKAGSRASHRD